MLLCSVCVISTAMFQGALHSTENFRNSRSTTNCKENSRWKTFKNLGIPHKVGLFSGNSGKCSSIRHWKFLEIQTRKLWSNGKRPWSLCQIWSDIEYAHVWVCAVPGSSFWLRHKSWDAGGKFHWQIPNKLICKSKIVMLCLASIPN